MAHRFPHRHADVVVRDCRDSSLKSQKGHPGNSVEQIARGTLTGCWIAETNLLWLFPAGTAKYHFHSGDVQNLIARSDAGIFCGGVNVLLYVRSVRKTYRKKRNAENTMTLVSFLTSVFADGRARVGNHAEFSNEEMREATTLLASFEREYRVHLPGTPPEFVASAALHGAVALYQVCQFLVFRDAEMESIRAALRSDYQGRRTAAVHYSVDVPLRFLPDAFKLTKGRASGDPLLDEIVELGNRWPLSSVGIPNVSGARANEFSDDACLLSVYADRIIAREDIGRLDHEHVRSGVRRAIGSFPQLAPAIADSLDLKSNLDVSKETSS